MSYLSFLPRYKVRDHILSHHFREVSKEVSFSPLLIRLMLITFLHYFTGTDRTCKTRKRTTYQCRTKVPSEEHRRRDRAWECNTSEVGMHV